MLSTWLYRSLTQDGHDLAPFLLTLGLFALCFVGLCISLWPYIIPTSVTLWEAAAPPSSQWFMLVGALVMLPLILGYSVMGMLSFPLESEIAVIIYDIGKMFQ